MRLNTRLPPLLDEARPLSSCVNHVLVPFAESRIPSMESGNSNSLVREQFSRSFVGLGGESRTNDANTPWFRIQATSPTAHRSNVQPAPPAGGGATPPAHRPDVPCETQDAPNLNAPGGPSASFSNKGAPKARSANGAALKKSLTRFLESDKFDQQRERFQKLARDAAAAGKPATDATKGGKR